MGLAGGFANSDGYFLAFELEPFLKLKYYGQCRFKGKHIFGGIMFYKQHFLVMIKSHNPFNHVDWYR